MTQLVNDGGSTSDLSYADTLWKSADAIDELLAHYDKLDEDIRGAHRSN